VSGVYGREKKGGELESESADRRGAGFIVLHIQKKKKKRRRKRKGVNGEMTLNLAFRREEAVQHFERGPAWGGDTP